MIDANEILTERLKAAIRQYRAFTERYENWTPEEKVSKENLIAALNHLAYEVASELDCALEQQGIEV